jgi:hypothetical protein
MEKDFEPDMKTIKERALGFHNMNNMINTTTTTNDSIMDFESSSKSSVKIIKNTKGVNIEVKVVSGEEDVMELIKQKALQIYQDLDKELNKELNSVNSVNNKT